MLTSYEPGSFDLKTQLNNLYGKNAQGYIHIDTDSVKQPTKKQRKGKGKKK